MGAMIRQGPYMGPLNEAAREGRPLEVRLERGIRDRDRPTRGGQRYFALCTDWPKPLSDFSVDTRFSEPQDR